MKRIWKQSHYPKIIGDQLGFIMVGIIAIGIYLSLYSIYVLFLLMANIIIKDKDQSLPLLPETRFGIVIPAHNEEIFLPRLLKSLKEQLYPKDLFDVIVIADNCSDKTPEVASNFDTIILERNDSNKIGKGFAIKFALENMNINEYDAIFIIDSDSIVRSDALKHLSQDIKDGNRIVQCYNGVANPSDSWFTRLMDVSRTIRNEIFEAAKEKLGLSSHLMGNGMCFHRDVISKYGWDAFSVGEDWEYYTKVIKHGERVAFTKNVRVYHQESSSLKQATPQRMRWSGGRFAIVWKHGFGLFFRGLAERNFKKVDASLPLIFPNPSLGINMTLICLVLSFLFSYSLNRNIYLLWFGFLILIQIVIFIFGIMCTRERLKSLLSLFVAPLFLVWKMGIDILSALGMGRKKWERTDRRL